MGFWQHLSSQVVVRNKTLHHGYKRLIKGYSNMHPIGTRMQLLSTMHKQILMHLYQFIVHKTLCSIEMKYLFFTLYMVTFFYYIIVWSRFHIFLCLWHVRKVQVKNVVKGIIGQETTYKVLKVLRNIMSCKEVHGRTFSYKVTH